MDDSNIVYRLSSIVKIGEQLPPSCSSIRFLCYTTRANALSSPRPYFYHHLRATRLPVPSPLAARSGAANAGSTRQRKELVWARAFSHVGFWDGAASRRRKVVFRLGSISPLIFPSSRPDRPHARRKSA